MKKKILIGIEIPQSTKEKIQKAVNETDLKDAPINWINFDNDVYLILSFLGFASDDDISKIAIKLKNVQSDIFPFSILFSEIKIITEKSRKRSVILKAEENDNIKKLKKFIEEITSDVYLPTKKNKKDNLFIFLGELDSDDEKFNKVNSTKIKLNIHQIHLIEKIKEGKRIFYVKLQSKKLP